MKQAALVLGIIAGVLGLFMGISVAGWIALTGWLDGQVPDALHQPQNAALLKIVGVVSPMLAIAGGAMAVLRPMAAALLLAVSAGAMVWAFGFGFFAMFPVSMCALAAILALMGGAGNEPGGMPGRR